ncbi:MAG: transaldolase [Bacteroidota bacterium]|nr:transaldolase [Bacteroidota bacterium]MDP4234127.1 transaldolase [Bacteroidota bacterium]MDP4243068.1 transaldolase [Bacteroidota bacterium]MDP4287494.1 transaldolase [Bacteroidota bacterium]
MPNRWKQVEQIGQSLWYDNLSREFIQNGTIARMIEDVGLRGITSNPTIFEKAISSSEIYDDDIQSCIREGLSTDAIYERLTTDDVRAAADIMRPVFDRTNGLDGFVSIEVDPRIAAEADASVEAARRLWKTVDRPNVMIKIPGTPECIPAIRQCLAEGININITLLFGIENYTEVAHAYLAALRDRLANGKDVTKIASVASFFLSRVDTNVDKKLETKIAAMNGEGNEMRKLLGLAAVANAKLAYERYLSIFKGPEFADLTIAGAQPQRCLWASVSTKNPKYSDIMYIEPLIGPETVTTVPDETIQAFGDHGAVSNTLATNVAEAHKTVERLGLLGIDMERVASELQVEGVKKFSESFGVLAQKLDAKRHEIEQAA